MTRRRLLLLVPSALLIAFAGVAIFFLATQTGLRLLWPRLVQALPGELAVESIEGRLIGPVELRGLRYRHEAMSLDVERLNVNWRPTALLFGRLRLTQLHADGITLALPPAPDEEPAPAPFTMPALPLTLSVSDARLARLSVVRHGETPFAIETVKFEARLGAHELDIRALEARTSIGGLNVRGRIALGGEIAADLRTDWSVTLPDYAEIRGGGSVTGDLAALHLDQRIETPAPARLQAVLHDWTEQARWEAKLEIGETDVRRIKATWPAMALQAAAEGKGDFRDWSVTGNFRLRQDQHGKLDGEFNLLHTPELWRLARLEIRRPDGAARLKLSARYPTGAAMRRLNLDAEWRELAWPLAGAAAVTSRRGNLRLAGTPAGYTLRLDATVAGDAIPPGEWSLRGRGDASRLALDHIEARLLDGRLTGRGHAAWSPELAWQLTLAGEALDPGRHWHDWPGRLAFEAETRGGRRRDRLQAGFTMHRMHGELRGLPFSGAGTLHIDGGNYRLEDIHADIGMSRLRVAGTLADRWDLRWEAQIDKLATLLPVHGALATEGRVTGPRATPRMAATAKLNNFSLERRRQISLDADIGLDAAIDEHGLDGRLRLELGDGDGLQARLRLPGFVAAGALPLERQALEGELSLRLGRLELLPAFFPDLENSRGVLNARLALAGTLGDPRVSGRVELADGAAQVPRLGLALKTIAFTAESDGKDRLRFEGRLRSGGVLRFNGNMQWPKGGAHDWTAELALKGERVEAVNIPEARVLVSPDLRLRARPRRVDVEGELPVPEARIEPLTSAAAVPVSRDVVLMNAPGEPETARAPWDLYSRVRLVLGDKVRFQGFGLGGNVTGSVAVSDEPGKPTTARGELKIVEGKYKAYGQDLDIERGRLLFAGGPIDNPGIDARAVRRSGEVLAGISVRGTLRSPVLTLFSDPPMPQTDALSYLILGRPLQQANTAEGRALIGAAGALTLTGGEMLVRQIGARFGFEEVSIEAGAAPQEASLVVGRYLSPKLFVAYSVGLFEQINLLRLRYRLSSRWTVQTETGTYSGADLLFTIER